MNESKRRKQVNGQWPCGKCKGYKDAKEFGKIARAWNGLDDVCKECRSAKRMTQVEKDNIWGFCMKKRYGLNQEDYKNLLDEQDGKCAICGKEEIRERRLSVDHCHETGKIRGLLCSKCNMVLGLVNDNKDTLINALNYLGRYTIT